MKKYKIKKDNIILVILLIIPLSFIIFFFINHQLNMMDYINDFNDINKFESDVRTIDDYDILIVKEINELDLNKPLEYPLSKYRIFPYTIVWKDTLSNIAYKFKLTKDEIEILVYLNKIKDKNLIIAGQTLLIAKKKEKIKE